MIRIFLIGYMGSGKSTLGKQLAAVLGCDFVDVDSYIERRYCKRIADLFAEKGEEAFRCIESRILREVSDFEGVVIATGGGAPCFCDNMALMNERGITVFLDSSIDTLVGRLLPACEKRPLLRGKNRQELYQFVEENLSRRMPFYRQSHLIFASEQIDTPAEIRLAAGRLADEIKKTTMSIQENIVRMLRTVYDPEIPVNVYDLGLIYEIDCDTEQRVTITMTLTAPNCPAADFIIEDVKMKCESVEEVTGVEVKLVFDPEWDREMMSEEAKLELGFL